jgi:hypothetical protein
MRPGDPLARPSQGKFRIVKLDGTRALSDPETEETFAEAFGVERYPDVLLFRKGANPSLAISGPEPLSRAWPVNLRWQFLYGACAPRGRAQAARVQGKHVREELAGVRKLTAADADAAADYVREEVRAGAGPRRAARGCPLRSRPRPDRGAIEPAVVAGWRVLRRVLLLCGT